MIKAINYVKSAIKNFVKSFIDLTPEKRVIAIITLILVICLSVGGIVGVIMFKSFYMYKSIDNQVNDYRYGALYYNTLTYEEQLLYNEISDSAKRIDSKTNIIQYSYTNEQFVNVINYILSDNPGLFYFDKQNTAIYTNSKRTLSQVHIAYNDTTGNIRMKKSELDVVIKQIISDLEIFSDKTQLESEIKFHDYLVMNCSSSDGKVKANTAYDALVNKKAEPEGYAKAFKLLMNKSDIYCGIVSGTVYDGVPHFWNIVNIDGNFYNVDTAWDDINFPYYSNLVSHAYFNVTDSDISISHSSTNADIIPDSDTESAYYKIFGLTASDKIAFGELLVNRLSYLAITGNYFIEFSIDYRDDDLYGTIISAIREYNSTANIDQRNYKEAVRIYYGSEARDTFIVQFFETDNIQY